MEIAIPNSGLLNCGISQIASAETERGASSDAKKGRPEVAALNF
jgi:hypothetical protein